MKRVLFSLFAIYYLLITSTAYAAESVESIKDKLITNIASRVAQLRLVEKRGIVGTVTDTSNIQITILDAQNNIRFIDVDELTKFANPKVKGSFGISDIAKDTTIGVLGLYNKESRRLLARFVDVIDMPKVIHGDVAFIDTNNFTFDVATIDQEQITIDVETTTRTFSYTKEAGLVPAGFSKLKESQRIFAVKSLNPKNTGFVAARIILFPQISKNPLSEVVEDLKAPSPIVPSTGSGKKITPLGR